MTFFLAMALAAAPSPEPRIFRAVGKHARYLRLSYDMGAARVRAKSVDTYDTVGHRYVSRTVAGVFSDDTGFDGSRTWDASPSGVVDYEDHADDVRDDAVWNHFYGFPNGDAPIVELLHEERGDRVVRERYRDLSGPVDLRVAIPSGDLLSIADYSGVDARFQRFQDYRVVDGFRLPFADTSRTRYRKTFERVRKVETLSSVPPHTFDAPGRPNDSRLDGTATVFMDLDQDAPVVDVRFGDTTLHMLFDSGSTNVLTPEAAQRLGLALVGRDFSGGVGPGVEPEQYALVPSFRIGSAELRHQVFGIIGNLGFDDVDGTIGCEVFEHFTVRFDFVRRRAELAKTSAELGVAGYDPIPMRLAGCTPEIAGSFEGIPGTFSIDTGSASELDVMSPFVRERRLLRRYRAVVKDGDTDEGSGIGGFVREAQAVAKRVGLGNWEFDDVNIGLTAMTSGSFDDPTEIGNVGTPMFEQRSLVFDYRKRRMWIL